MTDNPLILMPLRNYIPYALIKSQPKLIKNARIYPKMSDNQNKITKNDIRILQYNILAKGLAYDGFVCSDHLETRDEGVKTIPEFLEEIQEIKHDSEALKHLAEKYDTQSNNTIYNYTLFWPNRWRKIKNMIKSQDPDILVFQEMDCYAEALEDLEKMGYISTYHRNYQMELDIVPYQPMWEILNADSDTYLHILENQSYAFIPKLFSKARKFSLKIRPNESADNDGCAIFWKAERFTLQNLKFCQFYEYESEKKDEDGAMAVILYDKMTKKEICVITSHLPSGQTKEREEERLEILSDTDRGVFRRFISGLMKKYHHVIVALDANSDPNTTYGADSNVWQAFRKIPNLSSVWDPYVSSDSIGEGEFINGQPVTVNKIRGPKSNQPKKIGIHSYELIDHVFYSSDGFEFKGFGALNIFDSKEQSLNHLIPNEIEASDHYPVIVDFDF